MACIYKISLHVQTFNGISSYIQLYFIWANVIAFNRAMFFSGRHHLVFHSLDITFSIQAVKFQHTVTARAVFNLNNHFFTFSYYKLCLVHFKNKSGQVKGRLLRMIPCTQAQSIKDTIYGVLIPILDTQGQYSQYPCTNFIKYQYQVLLV